MIEYPHTEYWNKGLLGTPIIAFDKLDGQNLRMEWSKKRGWYKFGSRTSMFDHTHPEFGPSIKVFRNKYEEDLNRVFSSKKYREIRGFTVFCEWCGPNSAYGLHDPNDVLDTVLLDVIPNTKEDMFVEPRDFVKNFGHLDIPRVIYEGNLNKQFVQEIREGKYDVKEGVMCKGVQQIRGGRRVWIVKAKTNTWLDGLRNRLGEAALLEELNGDRTLLE